MTLKGIGKWALHAGACLVALGVLFLNSWWVWQSRWAWGGVLIVLLTFAAIGWRSRRKRTAAGAGGKNAEAEAGDPQEGGPDRSDR